MLPLQGREIDMFDCEKWQVKSCVYVTEMWVIWKQEMVKHISYKEDQGYIMKKQKG